MFRPQQQQSPADDPSVQAALFEMKTVSDLFAKMSNSCMVTFHEADLNVGEMSCADRCVGKYLKAQEVVGQKFQEAQQQQQQPQ
ncbi:hypothetical protein BASA82_000417 [Batrachochytrium salamandrivorans]|nr:hypothetical protein BASA82_000417 [Batrachochytrium salamandrivorans]